MNVGLLTPCRIALALALFAGFQGGRYFFSNRLQELGIACALGVYFLCAMASLPTMNRKAWSVWFMLPAMLCAGIMITWGFVFGIKFDQSALHSVMASREFLLMMIAPALVFVAQCGESVRTIERGVVAVLFSLAACYLYFYFTLDLQAAFFSADHTMSALITYDEWRGFRLKPPLFAIMLLLLWSLRTLTSQATMIRRVFALTGLVLCCYIWSLVQFRSTLATMILAIGVYPLFLKSRSRLHLVVLALPVGMTVLPILGHVLFDHFSSAEGGNYRLRAFELAWSIIPEHLLLGVGEDSAYGSTYQDLFAYYLFPSDLGLTGITLKYGFVGLAVYLYFHTRIWTLLWRTNQRILHGTGQHDALVWAMLIFMTAQSFNLVLNPGLAYAQGITIGALAYAYCTVKIRVSDGRDTLFWRSRPATFPLRSPLRMFSSR